jgi:molybdate-binding protein
MADPEYRTHVLAAVLHHTEMTGQHWHLSAVQKCQTLSSGDVDVGLVLCSGAACMMLNFKVFADMSVEQSHSRF